jgi:hypothetical protein
MNKYALIRQKRDEAIAKRTERKNRRTFPPSIFQLNTIIGPLEIIQPEIIVCISEANQPYEVEPDIIVCISEANQPYEVEPILEPILDPIDELVLLTESQPLTGNVLIENVEIIIEDKPDIINPVLIAQAEELRKLILLQETIKRFSKKKI